MTDMTTTTPEVETGFPAIEFAPSEAPLRPAMIGVLARAEAAEQAALRRVAELESQIQALRLEQITDGGDPRLVEFWDKAGRIADHADFCHEYDRLAEAMNGTPRDRDWTVTLDVRLDVRIYRTISATTEEAAIDAARDDFTREDVAEHIRNNGWDDIEVTDSSAERD